MTLFFYAHTTDLGVNTRLGTGWSVTESADNGTVAMSTFQLDDADGSGSITTLNSFHIDETGCDPIRLYSGYFADLRLSRADSLLTGEARRWDCTVSDLNFVFNRYVLRGDDANRPSETDTTRLAWLIDDSSFASSIADNGLVTGQGVTLDATDYRDRYAADVLSDCAQATDANWFGYFDDTTPEVVSLFYDLPSSTAFSSTLQISNVLADIDNSTTFYPLSDVNLARDPSRKASAIDLVWSNGRTYKAGTGLDFSRDIVVTNLDVKSSTAATALATKLLAKAIDYDVITATIQLPPSKVNLVRAGQRMQVKFSNLDGYESFSYLRVTRRTVAQAGETDQLYNVTLELASPFVLGGGSGGVISPPPAPSSVPATTDTTIADNCAGTPTMTELNRITGITSLPVVNGEVAVEVGLGAASEASVLSGCAIGESRWWGSGINFDAFKSNSICRPTDAVFLRAVFTATIAQGVGTGSYADRDFGMYCYLWRNLAPTSLDGGILLGTFYSGTVTIDIPAYFIDQSQFAELLFVPILRDSAIGQLCIDNTQTPISEKSGNCYGYTMDFTSLLWKGLDSGQTATASWLPVTELPDGATTTFTLFGWDGTGSPEVTVNGLSYPIISQSASAGTVTLGAAPPANAVVLARYPVRT